MGSPPSMCRPAVPRGHALTKTARRRQRCCAGSRGSSGQLEAVVAERRQNALRWLTARPWRDALLRALAPVRVARLRRRAGGAPHDRSDQRL